MNPKQWELTWNVSEADADTIETFLDARAEDSASFDWSPLDETDTYTINATFIQVFEP
jgi:phage-related protein